MQLYNNTKKNTEEVTENSLVSMVEKSYKINIILIIIDFRKYFKMIKILINMKIVIV